MTSLTLLSSSNCWYSRSCSVANCANETAWLSLTRSSLKQNSVDHNGPLRFRERQNCAVILLENRPSSSHRNQTTPDLPVRVELCFSFRLFRFCQRLALRVDCVFHMILHQIQVHHLRSQLAQSLQGKIFNSFPEFIMSFF